MNLLILLNFYHKASKTLKIAKLKKETKGSYLIRFLPRLSVVFDADGRKTDILFWELFQLSTIRENVSKRERKEFISLLLPFLWCEYASRYSCKCFLETLLRTGKCAWSSESLCSSRWSHHKTFQTNTVEPFISKQKIQIHFAVWWIRCQSRSIIPISAKTSNF